MKLSTQPSTLCTLLFALCTSLSALAAVPLRWTVETSRVQPAQFDAIRGETLVLEASFNSYGKPLEIPLQASLWWQTNGMGSAYWVSSATVTSNRISAVWLPKMDVGAKIYNCFIGSTGEIYRAAFQLRFRDGPGAVPNTLPLPTPVLDFSRVTVLNPPWPKIDVADIETKVDEALVYGRSIYSYMTANTNAWFASTNYLSAAADRASRTRWTWATDMDAASVPPSMALMERRDGTVQCVWDQRDWPKWYYDYREVKFKDEISQTNAALRAELNRLDTNKMSRGWSHYTAVNGLDNPYHDTTWIDTPKIILAAGYQWETSVESSGIWVLSGNGIHIASPTTEGEAEGSTYFKIKDFEGNAVLTVRKSDTRIVGAIPSSISVKGSGSFTVAYAVNSQPVGEFTTDLANDFVAEGDAQCPFNVSWAQSGPNYVATVTAKSGTLPVAAFMRAKYEVPGETIIDNAAPVKFSNYLQFGNLKIRPVKSGGSITWEEVQ